MKTQVKNRRVLAAIIAALAVLLLVGLAVLGVVLVRGKKSQTALSRPGSILAVELDSAWADFFAQKHSVQEQTDYLTQTLDRVKALGGNTILLTGRVGNDALFRGKQKVEGMPATASRIQANDGIFSKFDPLEELSRRAKEQDISVALLATDQWGTQLFDGSALPQWLDWVADKYRLPVYGPMSQTDRLGCRVFSGYAAKSPDLLRLDGAPGSLAAAYQTKPESGGLILGSLTQLEADPSASAMLFTYLSAKPEELPQLMDKPVPQELGIVSPAEGDNLWSDNVYLIGTSVPDGGPVTVNGKPVGYQGDKGVWGILLPVVPGENNYSAVQGGKTVTVTIQKPTGGGWGGGGTAIQSDGSVPAEWGQKLRITEPLASLLSDYGNPDSITMTLYQGAVAEVANSYPVTRGSKKSHVYQLQNGGFVRSQDCELLPPGTPNAAFTGAVHETVGRDEVITFQGTGTPAYTHSWEGNELTLTFLSAGWTGTEMPVNFGFGGALAEAGNSENSMVVKFHFSDVDPLWGYHVDYTPEGGTRIVLKHAPKRGEDPARPLEGVTVMLDPGHGGTDMGAIGAVSETFPQEKDMNLAEARAAQFRLEQLGATVLMTRTDDSFPTLGDRIQMLNSKRPDFFISLHHNSGALTSDLSTLTGTEVYWFYTEGKPLAQNLLNRVTQAAGRPDKGIRYNYFYVTRSNLCPAVLLETGFVCSPLDYEKGTETDILWAEGGAVAQAVLDSIPQ